jgi:glycosyltransferase involved in cell wall biosynthesis
MRRVDRAKARRPDLILSNSFATARQVERVYGVPTAVVYPPVRTEYFTPSRSVQRQRFALVVGRIEAYRGYERVIAACENVKIHLKIVGHGSALDSMRSRYSSSNTHFLGRVSSEELLGLYRSASMVVVPNEEDFCIVAVEAMATGTPVVALGAGGVTETVIEGETGIFFSSSGTQEMARAIERAMETDWDHQKIRARSQLFDEEAFRKGMISAIQSLRPPADALVPNQSPGLNRSQSDPTTI